jgi:hypothetical protein
VLARVCLVVVICSTAASALAEPHATTAWAEPTPAQTELYEAAFASFARGEHAAAIEKLRDALALGSFNMAELALGRALQRSGDCAGAHAAFERALLAPAVREPTPAEVSRRVEDHRRQLVQTCPADEPDGAQRAQPDRSPAGSEPHAHQAPARTGRGATMPRHARGAAQRTWGWVLGGAGVAILAASAVGDGVVLDAAIDDWREAERSGASDARSLRDDAETMQSVLLVGYVAGAVLTATGATLLLAAPSADSPRLGVAAWIAPGGGRAGAVLRGSF